MTTLVTTGHLKGAIKQLEIKVNSIIRKEDLWQRREQQLMEEEIIRRRWERIGHMVHKPSPGNCKASGKEDDHMVSGAETWILGYSWSQLERLGGSLNESLVYGQLTVQ